MRRWSLIKKLIKISWTLHEPIKERIIQKFSFAIKWISCTITMKRNIWWEVATRTDLSSLSTWAVSKSWCSLRQLQALARVTLINCSTRLKLKILLTKWVIRLFLCKSFVIKKIKWLQTYVPGKTGAKQLLLPLHPLLFGTWTTSHSEKDIP